MVAGKNLQSPGLPIIRNQLLQEWYTHAGGSVCVTSADSRKRFPDPIPSGGVQSFRRSKKIYRRVILIMVTKERGDH